jgi:hypothetical protein
MYKNYIGFGIAGNFAHHLDQAGEASDFVDVKTDEAHAPKGIFPFYVPNDKSYKGVYPLNHDVIVHPRVENGNLHMEPEIALICEIEYEDNKVKNIIPKKFAAYNDCSIRKENAKKISEKKNWGENTKGISSQTIDIDTFSKKGNIDNYHIASFLKRDGEFYEYGEDSPANTYNYMYEKLLNWIIDKLNNQKDFGPLENLSEDLKTANYPKEMVISIGATSYTPFGENGFLEIGDEIYVVVYDNKEYNYNQIKEEIKKGNTNLKNSSVLYQKVI